MTTIVIPARAHSTANKRRPDAKDPGYAIAFCDHTDYIQRLFINFNLGTIPPGQIVRSAILSLYLMTHTSAGNVKLRNIPVENRTWVEGQVSWNNQPVVEDYPNIDLYLDSMFSWHNWDITSYINDQYKAGVDADFSIVTPERMQGLCSALGYRSGSLGPRLIVTYEVNPDIDTEPSNNAIIEAIDIAPTSIDCQAPCTTFIDVTWKNTGGVTGTFTPRVVLDGMPYAPHGSQVLPSGAIVKKSFTIVDIPAGAHTLTTDPSGKTIQFTVAAGDDTTGDGSVITQPGGFDMSRILMIGLGIGALYLLMRKK